MICEIESAIGCFGEVLKVQGEDSIADSAINSGVQWVHQFTVALILLMEGLISDGAWAVH